MTLQDQETTTIAVLAAEYRLSERQVRYRLDRAGVERLGNGKWPLWPCIRALNSFEAYAEPPDADDLSPDEKRALEASLHAAFAAAR